MMFERSQSEYEMSNKHPNESRAKRGRPKIDHVLSQDTCVTRLTQYSVLNDADDDDGGGAIGAGGDPNGGCGTADK
jgi:hypothetical protein